MTDGVTPVVNENGTEILVVDPARLGEFLAELAEHRELAAVTPRDPEVVEPKRLHSFAFEAWPPDATERTLPGRTPRQMAASPREAREAAQAWLTAANGPGWTVGAGIHNRYACQPPHGGRDV